MMKHLDTVKITKCTNPEYIGFTGKLYTNLQSFHANVNILSIADILQIDKHETCIGIIANNETAFLWTKDSNFDVEITAVDSHVKLTQCMIGQDAECNHPDCHVTDEDVKNGKYCTLPSYDYRE